MQRTGDQFEVEDRRAGLRWMPSAAVKGSGGSSSRKGGGGGKSPRADRACGVRGDGTPKSLPGRLGVRGSVGPRRGEGSQSTTEGHRGIVSGVPTGNPGIVPTQVVGESGRGLRAEVCEPGCGGIGSGEFPIQDVRGGGRQISQRIGGLDHRLGGAVVGGRECGRFVCRVVGPRGWVALWAFRQMALRAAGVPPSAIADSGSGLDRGGLGVHGRRCPAQRRDVSLKTRRLLEHPAAMSHAERLGDQPDPEHQGRPRTESFMTMGCRASHLKVNVSCVRSPASRAWPPSPAPHQPVSGDEPTRIAGSGHRFRADRSTG